MNGPTRFMFERLLHQELTVAESYQSLVQKFNNSSEINDLIVLSSAHKSNVQDLMKDFSVNPSGRMAQDKSQPLTLPDQLSHAHFLRILEVLVEQERRLYQCYLTMIESNVLTRRLKDTLKKRLVERVRENIGALELLLETVGSKS